MKKKKIEVHLNEVFIEIDLGICDFIFEKESYSYSFFRMCSYQNFGTTTTKNERKVKI